MCCVVFRLCVAVVSVTLSVQWIYMHVGENGKKTKTEALHISKKLDETPTPAGEQVNMNNAIKWLGAIFTSCLNDSTNTTACISKAYGTIGALKDFSISREVPLDIKLILYLALPLDTALWGCASWALLDAHKKDLEVFHHRSIRRILGISMKRVREERINISEVRK
jgi:hypothetical protein